MTKWFFVTAVIVLAIVVSLNWKNRKAEKLIDPQIEVKEAMDEELDDMAIKKLREREYPGSEIEIEEELAAGSNYRRYIASYYSEGNKIFGLLTIPEEEKEGGWPIIAFIHGYIAPNVYRTTSRYVEYQDGLAREGFVTYKIDLRGHGSSEGEAVNGHFSEAYVVDSLNAIASLKKLEGINKDKIGIWGHSNGGEIGLRSMVVSKEIGAGVFWAGVVGSFKGMLEEYNDKIPFLKLPKNRSELVEEKGLPSENPEYWSKVDPYFFLDDLEGAIQLHHATDDRSVPIESSLELEAVLRDKGKEVELYQYFEGGHNLVSPAFGEAMRRSVEFFKTHLE